PSHLRNDHPPSELFPLSLHDALPISRYFRTRHSRWVHCPPLSITKTRISYPNGGGGKRFPRSSGRRVRPLSAIPTRLSPAVCLKDRKSTRLNSSHVAISYAVFCLKKK